MSKDSNLRQAESPSDISSLDRLIGTWKISGGASGNIRFERMEGRFFLIQHIDLEYGGRKIKGIELIGHLHFPGEKPSLEIRSRFYSFRDGLTLDYVYEMEGDRLQIWFGPKGSNNYFLGHFSADGNSFDGAWKWPSGGYEVKATRVG